MPSSLESVLGRHWHALQEQDYRGRPSPFSLPPEDGLYANSVTSAIAARTGLCSPSATASMELPVRPAPNGGQAIPATGNPLARSG